MNLYKITYILDGEEHYDHITERTEKAAEKRLKGIHKDAEITDTDLTSTEAPATKEQEREALEKIKALVAELGPQSYLATAFEGTFEDAETNIENDFAFSMKARVESAEDKLREMGSDYNALKRDAALLQERLTAAQEQIEALQGKQLPAWLHSAVYSLACEELATARQRMEQSAETMAYYAEAPQDIAFADAVKGYRAAKERREVCEQIVKGLESLTEN